MNRQTMMARLGGALVLLLSLVSGIAHADDAGVIAGTVVDALGARVAGAAVKLLREGEPAAETSSDPDGAFQFAGLPEGRYAVSVAATGFATRVTAAVFVGAASRVSTEVQLQIGPLEQQLVVTAAASALPQAQIGAPVTVIDAATMEMLGDVELLEPIRTVPGAQVVQTGARGGGTSLFIRGGSANFNKILIDGVPANDIGGAFDLADLATTGVERVEVMRGSNSVLYGSDALTGVVSVTTRRGRTRMPEATVAIDGGTLGTWREDLALGGVVSRVDYFADYSHLQTDNELPNNAYGNHTFAGRVGVVIGGNTTLTGTLRAIDSDYGTPNAVTYYGIPDDSRQSRTSAYASVAAESQLTDRWQGTIRAAVADLDFHYTNPSPTGEPFDPFGGGPHYLGRTVTVTAANGYSATGRAILDFGGAYPVASDSTVTRRLLHAQTDYHAAPALDVAGGVRIEDEHGTSSSGSLTETDRRTYGAFVEGRASVASRVYVTGGAGFDRNTIFGFAATPRVSVAAYLREPSATTRVGDTKVTFNAGRGIKAPSLSQELASVFALIPAATASRFGISPIGPERSRSLDIGMEQGLAGGRARVRAAWFHSTFTDLIEYVSRTVLPQLGVPVEAAQATGFGAYVNSQSNRARGVELSGEAAVGKVKVTGAYMHLDAVVTKSLGGALTPAINPAFPGIPIGAYSPLVGARPFRRPANSGSATVAFTGGRVQAALAGYFAGQSDDSTFLSDPFFGNSLLLPNQNFHPAYQKFDVSGSYQVHPRLRWYLTLENAFGERFESAAGFPALPRTVRTGVRVTVGGDRTP